MKVITMVYTKKIFVQDKCAILVPEMVHILITLNLNEFYKNFAE